MKRSITRIKGSRFCTLTITLEAGRLSITGDEGRIIQTAQAKKEALEYWRSFFEDSPAEIQAMNKAHNKRFTSARGAAKFVLDQDGELHGLDVVRQDEKRVFVLESCGQIRGKLLEYFPEVAPLLPWHLNDMRAGCEHQEALGWGHGVAIALAAKDLTEAQRLTLDGKAEAVCKLARAKEYTARWTRLTTDRNEAIRWLKSIRGGECSISDLELLMSRGIGPYPVRAAFERKLHAEVDAAIRPEPFEAAIYKDSISAPCPVCGYEYGTQWLKRDLPPEIVKLAETVCQEAPTQ